MRNKRISLYKAKAYIHGWPSIVYGYSKDFAKKRRLYGYFCKVRRKFYRKTCKAFGQLQKFWGIC